MWTEERRWIFRPEGSGYPSDLRDAEWVRLANQVGYDAGKQVKGRKIHALVDSEGLPMRVVVHSAAIQSLPRRRPGTAMVPGWCSTRYDGASPGSN